MNLRPDDSVQKILISTTARFTGEFSSENVLITQAWPPFQTSRSYWFQQNSPLGRTAIVVSFRTAPPATPSPGVVVQTYESVGEIVSAVLSVLFGKRFDVHGPYEMSGSFNVPDLSHFAVPNNRSLPYNSNGPRVDYPVPLELSQTRRIQGLLLGEHKDKRGRAAFNAAARFYRRALQTAEDDPEVAYLHLITAGEIMASHKPFGETEYLDEATRDALARIEKEMEGGDCIASMLRRQLRGIKRRFVLTILSYIEPAFFSRREATHSCDALQETNFRERVKAAYDLRSRYVHTGVPFGHWVSPRHENPEVQMGKPVVPDSNMAKILHRAPLFGGLERVMRCALLGFAQELEADLTGLDDPAPVASVWTPASTQVNAGVKDGSGSET